MVPLRAVLRGEISLARSHLGGWHHAGCMWKRGRSCGEEVGGGGGTGLLFIAIHSHWI